MVEVQEQAFAAVEKSEAKKIVVDEGCERAQDDVEQAEAAVAFGDGHLGAEGGVAVHVVDVVGQGGVGVVEDVSDQSWLQVGSLSLTSSWTARSSNAPSPLSNSRSFGSGQKPPCLIQRPKK